MIHDKYQHNQYQILKIPLEHLESRIFQIFMKLGTKVEKIVYYSYTRFIRRIVVLVRQ
jgi:hypothetical protein